MRNVIMQEGVARKKVADLEPGDKVDLEADAFADVSYDSEEGSEHPEFAFEFEIVDQVEREAVDCIRVDFESGFSCGFPVDHFVDVDGEA